MGLFDALRGGPRKLKTPAPDRLFAMTTAQVTLETALSLRSTGSAGIVFQALATADFDSILKDAEELVRGTAEETGSKVSSADDEFGYRWIILEDPDFDDLVVALNTLSTELQGGGYGDRLLCAVFPFQGESGARVNFIYNFKRGSFYPFVPGPDKKRDTEHELRLQAQLKDELPIEAELERWFPLWEIPLP